MFDFIGIIIIIFFFIRGYMKGIIVAAFSLISIVLGIIVSLKLSGWLAQWLLEKGLVTSGWAQIISYAILFIAVIIVVRLIAKAFETTLQLAMLGWANGLIGGLLYAYLGAIVWSSVLWISNQMHFISPETIVYSKTYKYFEPIAPWAFEQVGKFLPFAKDTFESLQHFFDHVNKTLPENVGAH